MNNLTLWLVVLAIALFFSLGMLAYTTIKQNK